MLCYRDMTFCTESTCTHFKSGECHRAYTDEVHAKAMEWWSAYNICLGPPVCTFTERPDCYNHSPEDSS